MIFFFAMEIICNSNMQTTQVIPMTQKHSIEPEPYYKGKDIISITINGDAATADNQHLSSIRRAKFLSHRFKANRAMAPALMKEAVARKSLQSGPDSGT
jgi:hypothetical protein